MADKDSLLAVESRFPVKAGLWAVESGFLGKVGRCPPVDIVGWPLIRRVFFGE